VVEEEVMLIDQVQMVVQVVVVQVVILINQQEMVIYLPLVHLKEVLVVIQPLVQVLLPMAVPVVEVEQ
jgi:hypothetical protein